MLGDMNPLPPRHMKLFEHLKNIASIPLDALKSMDALEVLVEDPFLSCWDYQSFVSLGSRAIQSVVPPHRILRY